MKRRVEFRPGAPRHIPGVARLLAVIVLLVGTPEPSAAQPAQSQSSATQSGTASSETAEPLGCLGVAAWSSPKNEIQAPGFKRFSDMFFNVKIPVDKAIERSRGVSPPSDAAKKTGSTTAGTKTSCPLLGLIIL